VSGHWHDTVHHENGVPWWEAKLPRRWHLCYVQTWGLVDGWMFARCPCGADRIDVAGYWHNKNSRRKERNGQA
jgi:hypothetical protein